VTLVETSSTAFSAGDAARGPLPGADDPAAPATLRVVVVDSHATVREGLPLLLRPEGIDVLGVASTGAGGETLIHRHQPDIALVSPVLADVEGAVLLRRLLGRGVRSAILMYAEAEGGEDGALAVNAGAAGVVGKRRTIAELAAAMRAVAAGGVWFGEDEASQPQAASAAADAPASQVRRTSTLSASELRVLALVADGRSTEEAAGALSLSPHTVRTHVRNVMRKLEASSRAHAVAIAIREAAIEA
jgi:DNA-binding NarL/FixJ family response regulator